MDAVGRFLRNEHHDFDTTLGVANPTVSGGTQMMRAEHDRMCEPLAGLNGGCGGYAFIRDADTHFRTIPPNKRGEEQIPYPIADLVLKDERFVLVDMLRSCRRNPVTAGAV